MGLTSSNEAKDHYPIVYYGGARSKRDPQKRNSLAPMSSSPPPSSTTTTNSNVETRSRSRTLSFRPNLVFASTVSTNENMDNLIPPALRKKMAQANSPSDIKETFKVQISRDVDGNKMVNEYSMIRTLGSGSYGKVKLCVDNAGKAYALKIVNKSLLRKVKKGDGESALQDVLREVAILKRLKHPNVVHLYEVMDDPDNDNMFMVMEYVDGGPVLNMQGHKSDQTFEEVKARKYINDIVRGLEYLASQKVVHRDIKNLLLSNDTIKLSDFGVSTVYRGNDDAINITAGTPAFMSPEACAGEMFSGKAADIWALGITLYIFIFGICPFRGDSVIEVFENVQKQPLAFPQKARASPALKGLLLRMLDKDPSQRIKISQIKTHPWMLEKDINTPRMSIPIPRSEFNENARQDVSEDEVNNAVVQMRNTADDLIMLVNVKRTLSKKLSDIRKKNSTESDASDVEDLGSQVDDVSVEGSTDDLTSLSKEADAIALVESDDEDSDDDSEDAAVPPGAI